MKLGRRQYVGYAMGDASNNLTFSMASAFLLIYYTDVAGISAATAGTLFLVVRVWGGMTDLVAGRIVDQTDTRWGRFRPYLLFASAPLLLLLVALSPSPAGSAAAARWRGPTSPTPSSPWATASSTSPTAPSLPR